MKTGAYFILTALLIWSASSLHAGEIKVLQKRDFTLLFDETTKHSVNEIIDIYPKLKVDLKNLFGWDMRLRPSILLVTQDRFKSMAESPLTVAFAVPKRNLIVIDNSRMKHHPFSLELTLKHELCHLLLHQHIRRPILPRWLDEGVAQWASDGIVDIIMDQKRSRLNNAALRGSFIPLHSLERGFPASEPSLILAYEESKSFISYIISRFGKEGVLSVLKHMKNGEDVHTAVLSALSVSFEELERDWHHSLRRDMTWFTYLSYHLYEILFALMALITIAAFVRILIRKRKYKDEDLDDRALLH